VKMALRNGDFTAKKMLSADEIYFPKKGKHL
jgi:hypothetical protein